jgi:hypothetical protein
MQMSGAGKARGAMKQFRLGFLCLLAIGLIPPRGLDAQAPPADAPPAQATPAAPSVAAPTPPVAAAATAANAAAARTPAAKPAQVLVPVGTRLPLVLHNGVSTRNAHPGDPLYFETLYPVLVGERIVIPAGSYVSGEITETKRPGRIKGRGEIMLRLTSMILPNGYVVSFLASPTGASTGDDDTVDKEGKIKGRGDKAADARTVAETTIAGASIGSLGGLAAGRPGLGAGIGAAAGVAAGIAAVLLTRGPELELPRGTTLDISLDRPLYLDSDRVQFTDPGHASTLPGPANREQSRTPILPPY